MEPLYFLFIKGEKCRYGQSNIIPFKAGTGENRPEKLEKRQYSENKKTHKNYVNHFIMAKKGDFCIFFLWFSLLKNAGFGLTCSRYRCTMIAYIIVPCYGIEIGKPPRAGLQKEQD